MNLTKELLALSEKQDNDVFQDFKNEDDADYLVDKLEKAGYGYVHKYQDKRTGKHVVRALKKAPTIPVNDKRASLGESHDEFTATDVHTYGEDGVMVLVISSHVHKDEGYHGVNVVFSKGGKVELVTADSTANDEANKSRDEIIKVARAELNKYDDMKKIIEDVDMKDVKIPAKFTQDLAHANSYTIGYKHGVSGSRAMSTSKMLIPGHAEAYKAGYKDGAAKSYAANKSGINEGLDPEHEPRTADQLEVGDAVVITGKVNFEGHTGEISRFGKDKKFVVVKLHSGGEHSFHSSDVSEAEREEDDDEDSESAEHDKFYVAFYDEHEERSWIGVITKEHGGKWHEKAYIGKPEYRWGKSYMSYLTPDDIMTWIHKDYSRQIEIEGPFFDAEEAKEHVTHNWGKLPESVTEAAKKSAKPARALTTAQKHKVASDVLASHGAKRNSFERQAGSNVSWFKLDKEIPAETRKAIADKLGMKEHPHAKELHYAPATYFVSHDHDLTFDRDYDEGYHQAILRTHKTAASRAGIDESVNESVYTGYADWKQAVVLSNPTQAKQIKFRAKMEGEKTTVIASIPGDEKIYGQWDESTETGKVIAEAVSFKRVEAAHDELQKSKLVKSVEVESKTDNLIHFTLKGKDYEFSIRVTQKGYNLFVAGYKDSLEVSTGIKTIDEVISDAKMINKTWMKDNDPDFERY